MIADSLMGELTQTIAPNVSVEIGFPPLPAAEVPTCGAYPLCNRTGNTTHFLYNPNLSPQLFFGNANILLDTKNWKSG
jgi:hypothetical protein